MEQLRANFVRIMKEGDLGEINALVEELRTRIEGMPQDDLNLHVQGELSYMKNKLQAERHKLTTRPAPAPPPAALRRAL